jgi:hypothetical protein
MGKDGAGWALTFGVLRTLPAYSPLAMYLIAQKRVGLMHGWLTSHV